MSETSDSSQDLASARENVHRVAGTIELLQATLLSVTDLLSAAPGEDAQESNLEDEMDERTELRSVLLCVVQDCLRPAIEDLLSVAEPAPRRSGGE